MQNNQFNNFVLMLTFACFHPERTALFSLVYEVAGNPVKYLPAVARANLKQKLE